jgi:hypothetical protein
MGSIAPSDDARSASSTAECASARRTSPGVFDPDFLEPESRLVDDRPRELGDGRNRVGESSPVVFGDDERFTPHLDDKGLGDRQSGCGAVTAKYASFMRCKSSDVPVKVRPDEWRAESHR